MTIQQLKYIIAVAEKGSITEAARNLYISQPSLSNAIKDIEKEVGLTIFFRSRSGVTLTKEGVEFLGYARQVLQQMELLEDRYMTALPQKIRFGVSAQHYTFTENAFVELVKAFGQDRYEFYFNATGTYQIIEDVKNQISDLGVLYLSQENEAVLHRVFEDNQIIFQSLFVAKPHVFLQRAHPLATKQCLKLEELKPYPRINFVQGNYASSYYAEEIYSALPTDKQIYVNDRGAVVNFMLGLNAYTISSGIFPKYLHGDGIVAIPLASEETICIGYIIKEGQELSELGEFYIKALMTYQPNV